MNIQEAKQEIIDTVEAYLAKDETGAYEIPVERQRPILLMGPPGIGKTAIMEQAAAECGINLVSYTITHHTRQSAIGLPFISKRDFGGREYSVTEYTMSEIIASVYEQIERSGVREGILFLDEINCVSETLAPTMLQFLQYKMFGTHRVPEGFVIVTAGNPPEYNKSVRDLDIVTLDRVKRIDIDVDFDAWKQYAYEIGIHGSILAYLEIRREHFYHVQTGLDGRSFVTARGWEDLSDLLKTYESLGIECDYPQIIQFVRDSATAAEFAAFYDMYKRYENAYMIEDVLDGNAPSAITERFRSAELDERIGAAMPSCAFCGYLASIGAQTHCLCNYIPGIMNDFDMGDLAGLIAPRPMIVVNGKDDGIFPLESAKEQADVARAYYAAANASDMFEHVIGPEGHRFYAALGWPVFDRLTGWREA